MNFFRRTNKIDETAKPKSRQELVDENVVRATRYHRVLAEMAGMVVLAGTDEERRAIVERLAPAIIGASDSFDLSWTTGTWAEYAEKMSKKACSAGTRVVRAAAAELAEDGRRTAEYVLRANQEELGAQLAGEIDAKIASARLTDPTADDLKCAEGILDGSAFSVPPLEDFTDNVEVADPGAVINDKDIERGAAA